MPTDPHPLRLSTVPAEPRGIVLMLHGGAEHGRQPVDDRSLAYLRTRWMFESISARLVERGALTGLLRFRVKGWNASHRDHPAPVTDARAALDELRARHPGLPIVLLGHSMGARTAAWVADDEQVAGVVGLAPWLPPGDPVAPLRGKHLLAAHGRRDRITSPRATAAFVERASRVAASASFVDMGPVGHYLFSGVRRWNALAVSESLAIIDAVSGITSPE